MNAVFGYDAGNCRKRVASRFTNRLVCAYSKIRRLAAWLLLLVMMFFPAAICSQSVLGKDEMGVNEANVNIHDVYLNDSFEVADAIAQAKRLSRAERWTDAASLLQRMSDVHSGMLVREDGGRYVGVRYRINHIIANWPKTGLQAYRALNEKELQQRLSDLGDRRDLDALLELFERFFCTAGAPSLADTIGQVAFEAGDFVLAERVYQTVIDAHPDQVHVRDHFEAMLFLLKHWQGNVDREVPERLANTKISWRGELRTLGSVLATMEPMSLGIASSREDWPIFGGSDQRDIIGSSGVDELGLLWQFALPGAPESDEARRSMHAVMDDSDALARLLSIQPVVSGDLIVIQKQREIVGLYRRTGAVAWRRPTDDLDQSLADDLEDQPPALYAPTVSGGRVYAALPGEIASYYGYESPSTPPAVICLDAASGNPIWSLTRESAGAVLEEIVFDTSPLVREGSVYVVGRRRRSFGFEDCYLLRIRATDGVLVHKTHLGSASTGSFGSRRATLSMAAVVGDTIYVCTNLGTVAAVAARTGSVRWLRAYDRSSNADEQPWGGQSRMHSPWGYNPAMVHDGQLFILPTDAAHLFVYDVDSGNLLHQIPREQLMGAQSAFGVKDGLFCSAGGKVVCYDLREDKLRWSTDLTQGSSVYGRGMWVDGELMIPTTVGISRFDVSTGSRRDTVLEKNLRMGNILALADEVYVAGPWQVSAYVRRSQLWRSLRTRMAESPADPVPALELAEVALRNGEATEAYDAIGEAVRRADAMQDTLDGVVRRRIYENVIAYVRANANKASIDLAKLNKLFDYASDTSPNGASQVAYRLLFASRYKKLEQPQEALRLYQQILRDRTLREEPVTAQVEPVDRENNAVSQDRTSGLIAASRIDDLLIQFGDTIYAQYESEALRWLESGKAGGDLGRLELIVRTFPNSQTAPLAMLAQADLLLANASPARAAAVLSAAYYRYPNRLDKETIIRRIADAYESAGRLPHAYSWLTKGVREYPAARFDNKGTSVSFVEYRRRLSHVRKEIEPSLPQIHWPIAQQKSVTLEENQRLLSPQVSQHPKADWSRYFVSSLKELTAYDAVNGKLLWRWPLSSDVPADLVFASKDLALFLTANTLYALDPSTGKQLWKYGEPHDKEKAPDQDWEAQANIRTIALSNSAVVVAGDRQGVTCLETKTGTVRWSHEKLQGPRGTMRVVEPWVVYHFAEDGGTFCRIINIETGEQVRDLLLDDPRSLETIFLTLDGRLITVTAQSLSAYDIETGVRSWRYAIDGMLRRSSLFVDFDAIYFSEDGRRVRKLNVENGRTVWLSDVLCRRPKDDMRINRQGASVVVHTSSSVAAVDEVNGLTLWEGVAPDDAHFISRGIVADHFLALHHPDNEEEAPKSQVYLYDLRHASGLLRGTVDVGDVGKTATILLVYDGFLIQTEKQLKRWSHDAPKP